MIQLGEQPVDLDVLLRAVEGPGEGAVVLFVGRVRDHSRERDVTHLDYEAYGDMARQELERLAAEAVSAHGAARVALAHRVGRLEIGEIAVAIAVSAGHRPEAFAACRWLIDTLKQQVPIWKKEWYGDGSQWIAATP